MTHHELRRVEADGTRVYSDYHRYTPVPVEQRKYGVNKPDHPGAVRFHGRWFLPLELLPMRARAMPETRPDDQTLEHRAQCRCQVCQRPQAAVLWRRQRARVRGVTAASSTRSAPADPRR